MCREKEIEFERSIVAKCPRCLSRIKVVFTDSGDLVEAVDGPQEGIMSRASEIRKKAAGLLPKKESPPERQGKDMEQGD